MNKKKSTSANRYKWCHLEALRSRYPHILCEHKLSGLFIVISILVTLIHSNTFPSRIRLTFQFSPTWRHYLSIRLGLSSTVICQSINIFLIYFQIDLSSRLLSSSFSSHRFCICNLNFAKMSNIFFFAKETFKSFYFRTIDAILERRNIPPQNGYQPNIRFENIWQHEILNAYHHNGMFQAKCRKLWNRRERT